MAYRVYYSNVFCFCLAVCLSFPISCRNTDSINVESEFRARTYAICQIWGLLKYHNPIVSQGKYDWDSTFVDWYTTIVVNEPEKNIDDFFESIFDRLNNDLNSNNISHQTDSTTKVVRDSGLISRVAKLSMISNHLRASLTSLVSNNYTQPSSHYYHLDTGEAKNAIFDNERFYAEDELPDEPYRILAVCRYWNAIISFYPYYGRIESTWDSMLLLSIKGVKNARTSVEYNLEIQKLCNKILDGHSTTFSSVLQDYWGTGYLPVEVEYINGEYVVLGTSNNFDKNNRNMSPQKGDVLLQINGRMIDTLATHLRPFVPGANESAINLGICRLLLNGNTGDSATLTLSRSGIVYRVNLCYKEYKEVEIEVSNSSASKSGQKAFFYPKKEILFVQMKEFKKQHLTGFFNALAKAKVVIFDLRCYPEFNIYEICDALYTNRNFCKVCHKDPIRNGSTMTEYFLRAGGKQENEIHVIILVNNKTGSRSEFMAMALQASDKAITIGSQTFGSDGNISYLPLPGGIVTNFSGLGISYPNGNPTQGNGLHIDYPVRLTKDDLINRKDIWLETSLRIADSLIVKG